MDIARVEGPPTFLLSRWLFLRLLGGIYLIAFVSLGWQIIGLIGEDGILPAGEYLERAEQLYGTRAHWMFPTLAWLSASDTVLRFLCLGGTIASVLLITGVAPMLVLALLWVSYLSVTVVGQTLAGMEPGIGGGSSTFQLDGAVFNAGFPFCSGGMQVALGVEVQNGLTAGVWSDFVGISEAAVQVVQHIRRDPGKKAFG